MMHFAKIDVPRYLREKRARKAARRRLRRVKSIRRKKAEAAAFSLQFGQKSKIIKMMTNGNPPSVANNGQVGFRLPKVFSIIDDPGGTLRALTFLAQEMRTPKINEFFFDFGRLEKQDLGANGVLDVLVQELSTQAKQTGRKIRFRGTYPEDAGLRRFLRGMGVIKRLKITHEYPTQGELSRLVLFNARCRHYIRALKPRDADKKSRVTRAFADHINKCLASIGRTLTPAALGQLCQYVGEIIDNAEEHADMLDWAIEGYFDPHLPDPICEIVIFNFGKTISESFESLSAHSFTRQQIKTYIDLHQRQGFFQHGWRVEDLYTLIALQGGVSTKNMSDRDTRGNGTVDLIEFFQRVHTECSSPTTNQKARMVILSGGTYVLFDGKYKMEPNSDGVRIIAFNDANDLNQKPDTQYICHLDGVSFPGTIISIKFPLSSGSSSTVVTEAGGL